MPEVILVAFTDEHRHDFLIEEVAGYAEQQIRDAGWSPESALAQAQAELGPVLGQELQSAAGMHHRLWTALSSDGEVVGWLWVTPPLPGLPPTSAFLYQITVRAAYRRQGYGQAMLAALERVLVEAGTVSLHLHVNEANQPARRLYERAGYQLVEQAAGKCHLGKSLHPA